jgi:site-specific DNA-methyltransferase (adenine-specific)
MNKPTYKFTNTDAITFLSGVSSNSIDLVLTDPPYLVSKDTGFTSIGNKGIKRFAVSMDFGKWDRVENGEHAKLLTSAFTEAYRVLRKGGTVIVFYDIWKIESLCEILKKAGFSMLRLIEWLKTNPVPLNSKATYLSNGREVAIVAVKGSKPTFNTSYHNGVFSMPIHRDGGKRLHPTQKPLALMRELIKIHTKENDTVLDPFAGSATTLVSALQLNRTAIGCEIDTLYFKKANKRIEDTICQKLVF